MNKVLILSHGNLAKELFNTARLILGDFQKVTYLCLLEGQDMNEYESMITKIARETEQELLILVDMLGGSPFIISAKVYQALKGEVDIQIVTGVNLPMVIETIHGIDQHSVAELKDIAVNFGSKGVVDFVSQLR